MLLEIALVVFERILAAIFVVLGVLPDMPESIVSVLDDFFNLIWQGIDIALFFVPMDTVVVLAPIVIAIMQAENIYELVMFILRKIPFLNIK